MVRETRYLIVRNLPENCTEEKVIDHFQRYGKIQSVKLQAAKDNDSGGNTATVAFNDIKSAAKAHHAKNNLGEVTLRTDYWEGSTGTPVIATTPVTTPTAVRPNYTNAPASTSKTVASFTAWKKGSEEETSSNQEKVVAAVASGASTLTTSSDKVSTPFDHPSRSRPRERLNKKKFDKLGKNGSFGRHGTSTRSLEAFRSQSEALGLVASTVNSATTSSISASGSNGSNGGASVLNPIIVNDPKDINSNKDIKEAGKDVVSKSAAASPGSRNSGLKKSQSNSRSVSRSRSKSQGSKSSSSRSDSSGTSRSTSPHKSSTTRPLSMVGASKLGSSEVKESKKDENDIDRRPLGICVKGLPLRSTDSSLRDGLYHEYKKHGKVTSVQICLEGDTRCAIVSFRKPEDASKALEASQGKIFFGTKIRVTSHEGVEVDEVNDGNENDSLDEYHPKSTRTLFVGNLEKETIKDDLIEKFKQFGEIIDVDVKRQGATTAFAFVQYVDITSVVAALRAMEGEHIGINKIKLGFGKSMPTFCVWVDNLPSDMTSRSLKTAMARYGDITYCFVDKIRNRGLIYYTNYEDAQHCVSDIKMRPHLMKKKLQIDFASRECQNNFLDRMEETGQMRTNERPDESRSHTKFRQRSFENVTEEGSPSSFVYSRSSSGYGSRRRRQYDSNYTEESHQTSRRSRRAAEDFTPQSNLYYSGKGTSDDYVAELREYEYSKRERRDRDLSPRHSSADRRIDGQSCRGSRDHSLDRYEERQKERSGEVFNSREISPGSEHNSFHSENRYRSSREDKYLNRDRYEDGKTEDKDFDHHSRPSRTTSPFLQNHTSLHSHDSDLRRLGSQSPPTPLQEDAPRFYLEDYKQRVEDDFDSYSSRRRDSEELKSKSWINSSKLGAEMIKTVESRKRSHEQSGLSDLTKLDSKLVRKHEKSSTLAENKLKKIHRQLEANKRGLKDHPSSPGSSGSHGDSENGSVSEGDLHHLHQEKQHILKELKECEAEVVDASEPESPHSGARMKSVAVKDNSKLFGRILEDKRAEELSFRRQEKLRRLNSKSWNHISDDMSSTREDQHLLFEKEDSPREHSDSDLELKMHVKKRRTEFPSDSSDDEHLESCSEQNVRIPNSLLDRRAMCDSKTNSFKFMENSKLTDVSSSCDNGHLYKGGLSDKDSSVIQSYRTSSSISNPYLNSEWNMPLPAHESSPPGFSSTYSEENTQDSVMSGSLSDKSFKSPPGSPLGKYCSDSDSYSKYVVPDPEDSFSDDSLSDNQHAQNAKDLEERLRCIDEILNGTTSRSSDLTISSSFTNERLRKSGLDGGSFLSEKRQEPSVIMQQVLNKKSILDQDIIRLKCNNKMDQTAELELGIKPLLPISTWPHPVTTSSSMLQPTITTSVANSLSTAPISTSVLTASIVSAPATSSINISPKTAAVDSLLSSRLSEPANNCGLPAEKLPVSTNLTLDVPLSSVYSSTSTSKSVFSLVQCSSVDSIVDTNLLICPPEGKCTSTSLPPSLPSHTPLLSVSLSSSLSLHVKSTLQQIVPPSLPVTPCPSSSSIMSSVTKSPVGSTVAAPFTQGPDKLQLMPTVGQEAPHIYSSSFTPENSRTSTSSHLPGNQSSRVPAHKPRDDQHNKQELIVHIIKTEDESKNNVTVSKTEDVTPDIESPVSVKSETSSNSSVPLSSIDNKNNLALEDKSVPIVQTSSSENNNIVIVKSPISSVELKTGVSTLFLENTLEKSDSFDVIEAQTANTNVKQSDVLDWSSKKPEVSPPVSSLPVYGVITKDNPDKKDLPSPSDNINKGKTMSSLSLNNDSASKVNANAPSTSSLSSTRQSSERSDKKSKTSHSHSKNPSKSEALFAPDVKVEQPKEKTESKHPNKDSHKTSNKSSTSSDKKVSKSCSKEALDNKVVSGSSKDHDKKSELAHKSSGHESSKTDKNKVKDKKESEKTKAKEETKKKEDKKPATEKTETKSGATKEDKKVDKKVDEKKEKSEKDKSKETDKHPVKKSKTESTDSNKKDKKLKTKETMKVVEKKAFSSLSCVTKSSTPEVKSKDAPKSDMKLKTDASKSEEKAKFESKHKLDSKSTNKSEKSESHLVPKKVSTDSSKSKKENEKESNKHLSLNVKKKEEKLKQKLKDNKSKDETKEKQKEEKEKAEKEENERQREKEKKELKEKEEKEKLRREKEEKERQKEERERKEKEEKLRKEKEEREKQKEQERLEKEQLEKERKEREEKEKQKEREEREKLREKEERERREREREERERKEKEEKERKEREKEEKERKEREKEDRERERKEKEKEEKERKEREEKERKEKEERERKEKEKEERERKEKEKEEKERKEKERKEKEKREKKEKERKAKEEKLRKEKEEKAKKEREEKAKKEREEKSKKDEKGKKEKKDKKEEKDKKDDKDDDDKSDKKPPPKKPKRNELAVLLDSNDRFQMTFTSMYDRVKTQRNREPEQHKPEPAPKSSFDKFKKNLKKKGKKAKSSLYSWGSNSDLTDDSDLSESGSSIKADSVKETKPKKTGLVKKRLQVSSTSSSSCDEDEDALLRASKANGKKSDTIKADSVKETKPKKTGLVKKRLHVSSTSSSSCDEDEDALLRASKANGKKSDKIFSSDSDEDNFPIPKSSNKSKSKPAPKRRKTREDSTDSMTSKEEFVKPHAKNVNEDSLDDLDLSDDDDAPKLSVKKKPKAIKRPDKSTDGDKPDSSFESVSKKPAKVEQEALVEPVAKKSHKTDKDETPAKKLKTDSKVIKSDSDRKSSAKSEDKNKLKDSSSDKKERKDVETEIKLESKKESENKKDIDGKKSADSKKEEVKKEVEVKHENEKPKGKDTFFGELSLKHSDEKKKKKDKEESVVKKKKKKKLDPKAEEESVNSLINKVYDSSKFDKDKKQKKRKKPIVLDSDSDMATSETSEVSKPATVEEKVVTKSDTEILKSKEKHQESVKEKNLESFKEKTQDSVKEKTQDSVKEKNQDSVKEKNLESFKEKNQDSVKEKTQDSVKEKTQDSVKEKTQESVKEKNQESVKEKNQDSVKEKEVIKEKHSKETNKPSNDAAKKSESKKKDASVDKESDKASSLDVHKRDKKTKDKVDHSERKSFSSIEDLSTKPPKKKKKKKEHEKESEKEKSKPSKIKKVDDNKLDGNKKASETETNSNADSSASQQSQVVDEFVSFWGHPKPILIPKRLKDTPKADDDKKHKEKDDCKSDEKMETSLVPKEEIIKDEKVVNDKPEDQQDADKTVKVEVETNEDVVVPISEAETTVTTELAQSTSSEIAAMSGSAHQSDAVSEDVAGVKDETTIGSSVEIHEDDEDPSLVIDELSESVSDEKKKLTKKEKKLLKQQQEEKERNDHMDEVIAFVANAGSGDEDDTGDKESPSSLQIDSASNDRELDLLDVINLKYETKFSNEKEHKSMIVSDMFFQDDKKKAPETAPFSAFRKDKKETPVKKDGDQEVPQKPTSLAKNDDTSLEEGATVASTESPEKEKEEHKLTEEEIKKKEAEELRKKQEEEERKAEEERKKVEEEKARQEKEQQAIREASDEAARAVESILEFENTLGLDIEDDLPPLNIESESIETPTEIPVSPSKDKSETELFFNNAIPEKLTANLDDQLLQESKLLIKGDHADHKMDPLSFFAQPQHAVIPGFTSPRRNSVVQDRPSEPSVALQSPQRQIPQSPQIQSPQIQSPQMPSPQRHMQSPQRQLTSPQRIQSPQRPLQSPLRPLHSPQIGLQSPPFFNKDAKMERSILSPNREVLVMHEMEPSSVQTTQRRTSSGVPVTAPETSIDPLRRKSQEFPSEQAFHSPRRNTISVPEEAATTHLEHRFQHHQGASVIYSKKSPHGQSSLPPPVSISLDNAPHDKNFQTPIRNISIPPHQDCNLLSPKKMSPSVHFKDIPADPTIFQNTSTNKTHLTDSLFPSPKALFSEFSHHQKHSTQEPMFYGNKSQIHDILKATIPSPDQHIFFTAKGTMPDKTLVAKLPDNNFSTRTLQEQLFQQKVNPISHERISQDSVFPPKGHLSQDSVFPPKGHLSQDSVFSPKGHLSQDSVFSPKGHLPQDTVFSPKGHLSQDTVFSPKGHISQEPVFSPKGGHLDASYNYTEPVVDFLLNSPPRNSDFINYTPNSEVQKQLVVKPVEAHDLFNNKDTFHPVDSRLNERVEQPPRRMEGFPPSFYQEPTPAGNMPKFAETVNLPPTPFDDDKKNPRKRNRNNKKNTKEDRAAALAEQQAIEQSVQANLESIHKSLSASQAKKAETNPSEKKKSPIDAYDFEAGQEMMPSTMSAMEHTNFSEDLRQTRSRMERGKRNNRGGYGTRRGKNGRGGMMSVMESPESLQRQEPFSLHQQPVSQQTPFNVQQSQDQMITTPQAKPLGYLSYQFPSQQQQQSPFQRQNSQPTNPSFYPSPQSSSDNTSSMSLPEWQMKPVPQQHSQNTLLQQPIQSVLPQQHGQNALPQQHGQNALPQQHSQNALPQQHSQNALPQHGQTLQSLPQQHISHQQPALQHQQQPQIPQQLKLPVKVDERSPETNKLDLDSSFGESQLVINLDDQPSSIEGKENQNSLSSDGESPATPKTQRSTRARKQTNYKAIASGTITVQPTTRLSRSGGSPRGRSAGTQSPKNNMSPRASSSENVQSSPVVKLEKLEVTRTTRRRKAKEEAADENSSFEDWKAKKGEDKKVVPKDNVYEFDDTEQDQNKEPNLRSRTRKKRTSENQDPTQIGVDYLAASPPASNSSLLSDPKGSYESLANDTKPTEEVSKQTPLSNVDAVIDAVSKGLFGSIEEDSNQDIPLSAPSEIASTPSPLPAAPTTRQTRRSTEAKKEAEQKEVKFTIEPAKSDVRDAGKKGPTVPPIRIKVAHVVEKKEEKHYTIERANKTVNSSTEHHEKPPLAFTVKLSDTGTATIKPAGSGNIGGHLNSNTSLIGKNSVTEGIKYGENKVQDGLKYGESNLKRDNNLGLFSGLPQNEQQQPITEQEVIKSVPSQSTPWKPVDSVAMDSPITRPSGTLHPKVAAKVQASQESMNASSMSALLPNNVAQTSQQQPILPVTSAALPSQAKPSVSPVHSGLMWNSIQGNLNQPPSNPHLPMHLQNSSLMKDPSLLLQRPPSAHDLMNKRPPSAHSQTSIRPDRPVVKGAKMGGMDEMVSKINVDGSQKHSEAPFGFAGPVPPAHIGQRPYMMEQQGIPSAHHSLHFPNSAFKTSLEMRNTKSPSIPPQTSLKIGSEMGARTPPVTAAPGAMLYAGIVSSQPISLSPTSASPEGQVIERHPNPNSLRETGCQSPLSLRMHSDPRFLKDDLENSVQSSVHGEQTSTREMMFLMEQQRLRQHLLLVQENNRTANPDQGHPADARNMRLAHDQARNTPVGPNGARKSSLSSQPVGLNQPLNLADSDSRVDPSRTPKSTPPAPQSPFSLPYLDRKVEPGRMQVGVTSAFMQPSSSGACEAIAHMYPDIPLGLASQFNLVGRLYGPGHQPQSHLLRENVMQGHFPPFAPGPRFQVLEPYDKKGEPGHQDPARGLLGSPSPNPMLSRQADLLLMKQRMPHELQTNSPVGFLQRYPVMWQGALALKNDNSYVQMHFIAGNRRLPNQALPQPMQSGVLPPLRISQRMRLEQAQLEGVSKRMQCEEDYCILIAVACGRDQSDISVQTRALNEGFITYLLNKQAAGIVNVPLPGSEQAGFVVHIFPPCDFVDNSVAEQGSITLMEQLREVPHAVIIIATT